MKMKDYFLKLYEDKYGDIINKDLATMLVDDMAVTDGSSRTTGERWSMEESKTAGEKIGVNWQDVNNIEWYLVLNMMYSDYYKTAKKHGLTDSNFFAELAYDWFYDADGEEDKTFNYFMSI